MSEYGAEIPVGSPIGQAIAAALAASGEAAVHLRIWRKPAESGNPVPYTLQIDDAAPVTVELPHGLERGLLRFMAMGIAERVKKQATAAV